MKVIPKIVFRNMKRIFERNFKSTDIENEFLGHSVLF